MEESLLSFGSFLRLLFLTRWGFGVNFRIYVDVTIMIQKLLGSEFYHSVIYLSTFSVIHYLHKVLYFLEFHNSLLGIFLFLLQFLTY